MRDCCHARHAPYEPYAKSPHEVGYQLDGMIAGPSIFGPRKGLLGMASDPHKSSIDDFVIGGRGEQSAPSTPLSSRARARSLKSGRAPGDQRFVSSGTRWGNGAGLWGPASGMPATGPGWGQPTGKSTAKPRADASALTPGCSAAKRERAAVAELERYERDQPAVETLLSLMRNAESQMVQVWAADRVLTIVEGSLKRRRSVLKAFDANSDASRPPIPRLNRPLIAI